MEFVYDDGGREAAGYKGKAGDCACRALSIATGMEYREAYRLINRFAKIERVINPKRGKSSARTGVYKETFHKIMASLGWKWKATMEFGKGCTTHMRKEELPDGRIICNLSKHYAAVIDGVLHDTYDSTREGNRCVYGCWYKP